MSVELVTIEVPLGPSGLDFVTCEKHPDGTLSPRLDLSDRMTGNVQEKILGYITALNHKITSGQTRTKE